jgi:hypothetical protein
MTASEPTVALIPKSAECGRSWLPDAEERWQAHLGIEERRGLSERPLPRCPVASRVLEEVGLQAPRGCSRRLRWLSQADVETLAIRLAEASLAAARQEPARGSRQGR